jgi:hypothetical protein
LHTQDAGQQGKLDTALLNQMSVMVSAQGYSLTNKVLQTCNGWLMDAKRPDGSPPVVFVDPKTQTIVDADFRLLLPQKDAPGPILSSFPRVGPPNELALLGRKDSIL